MTTTAKFNEAIEILDCVTSGRLQHVSSKADLLAAIFKEMSAEDITTLRYQVLALVYKRLLATWDDANRQFLPMAEPSGFVPKAGAEEKNTLEKDE